MQACKPGSVSRQRHDAYHLSCPDKSGSIGLPTPISGLTDKNGPFIFIGAYLTFQLARFTMRLSLLAGRWALTPPFHYHPDGNRQGYLFSVVLSVILPLPEGSPCFRTARCPMLPGLSSPIAIGAISRLASGKDTKLRSVY